MPLWPEWTSQDSQESGCDQRSFRFPGRLGRMQTISLPYRCSAADRTFLDDCPPGVFRGP